MANSHTKMTTSPVSCGVLELGNIPKNIEKCVEELAHRFYHPAHPMPESLLMASDTENSRSHELMLYLEKHKLAEVKFVGPILSPKTGNAIVLWIAAVDHLVFRRWYTDMAAAKIEKRRAMMELNTVAPGTMDDAIAAAERRGANRMKENDDE